MELACPAHYFDSSWSSHESHQDEKRCLSWRLYPRGAHGRQGTRSKLGARAQSLATAGASVSAQTTLHLETVAALAHCTASAAVLLRPYRLPNKLFAICTLRIIRTTSSPPCRILVCRCSCSSCSSNSLRGSLTRALCGGGGGSRLLRSFCGGSIIRCLRLGLRSRL